MGGLEPRQADRFRRWSSLRLGRRPLLWDDDEDEWDLIAATSTDADGKYCFCNLDPYQNYKVAEHGKSGWVHASPTSIDYIKIPESGGKAGGNDFLNARLGSVCGTKWEDWNLDKQIGSGDGPVSGWAVDLYVMDEVRLDLIASTSTGADGKYCFCDLDPYLYYKVVEEDKTGWVHASPTSID